MKDGAESFPSLQSLSMHNIRRWVPENFSTWGGSSLLSASSSDLVPSLLTKIVSPDTNHYEGKVLPVESVSFPRIVSLRVWGITPFLC